jgi:hypothetical protein
VGLRPQQNGREGEGGKDRAEGFLRSDHDIILYHGYDKASTTEQSACKERLFYIPDAASQIESGQAGKTIITAADGALWL